MFPPRKLEGTGDKVEAVTEMLRQIAYERGPDEKMPTTREIRGALGVGMATLDNALNELEAQNVLYRRHGVGIFVSPRLNRKTVAVLLDATFFLTPGLSPFWSMLWGGLAREAQARTETRDETFLFNLVTTERAADYPLPDMLARQVAAGQVHAAIAIGLQEAAADYLERAGVPVVGFAGAGRPMVENDGRDVVREGVAALAEQGCTRIGLWRPVTPYRQVAPDIARALEETAAFREALAAHGRTFDEALVRQPLDLIREETPTTQTHQEQGYRLATEVFGEGGANGARPDGIVVTDDMMTSGVLAALAHLDLRAGRDVRIATHANHGSPILFGYEPDLVRIEADPAEIVRTLYACLDRHLAGQPVEEGVVTLALRRAAAP